MPDEANAQDPNAAAAAASPANSNAGAAGTPAAAPSLDPALVSLISETVKSAIAAAQPAAAQPPAVPATPVADDLDAEIKLRKDQLSAIQKGEIDAAYGPEVQAALASAISRKEGRAVVERENIRSGFVQGYNENLGAAYKDFPELADPNSELAKETLKILSSDRGYQRIQTALKAKGRDAEKIDFSSLDPAVTLNAAHRAHSTLIKRNGGKPLSQQQQIPNPKVANAALEAGSGAAPVGDDDLAKMEREAVESGDQSTWRRYIKVRDQRIKAKAHTV